VLASILLLPLALTLSGCDQQLEEEPFSQITPENFFSNEKEFLAAATGVYSQLRPITNFNAVDASQHSADAIMVPTRGPNWGDGGIWRELTQHTWSPTHPDFNGTWTQMYTGIARANGVLTSLAPSQEIPAERKAQFAAEIRFLRAYYYYWLMDFFGGVPLVVEEGNETYSDLPKQPLEGQTPAHQNRKQVYDFILQELTGCTSDNFSNSCVTSPGENSVLANLQSKQDVDYGRATTGAGYAFLARLLLNSQMYAVEIGGGGENRGSAQPSALGSGPAFYEEALTAANIVINGSNGVGTYSLADDYFKNFAANNQTSPEMIFPITYQPGSEDQGNNWTYKQSMHYSLSEPGAPWNGFTTIAEFYKSYATEPGPDGEMGTQDDVHNDTRGKSFLVGQQYEQPNVGCAGDECYSDTSSAKVRVKVRGEADSAGVVRGKPDIDLIHTLEIPAIQLGEIGGTTTTDDDSATVVDEFGFPKVEAGDETFRLDAPGARPLKFEIDPNTSNDFFGNDYPIFRLAEMYLIRAEAQWATNTGDPIATLNTLRSTRARAGADISLTGGSVIEKIMRERGHELLQEFTRRQDLIRYEFAHGGEPSGFAQASDQSGVYSPTFTGPWLFKDASDPHRALFPVPQQQISTNPKLGQNPGYGSN
jgi:hypothetical protein